MRISLLFILWLVGLTVPIAASAQTRAATPAPGTPAPVTPAESRQALWRCELPGGIYQVALRNVVSVSMHDYTVDGLARVTEVNVDTTGATVVRFYFIEPTPAKAPLGLGQSALDRMQELAKEASTRVGADQLWQKVTKNYPTTTHAHTVEYRLESKAEISKLFDSADRAFRTGQGATIKLP